MEEVDRKFESRKFLTKEPQEVYFLQDVCDETEKSSKTDSGESDGVRVSGTGEGGVASSCCWRRNDYGGG